MIEFKADKADTEFLIAKLGYGLMEIEADRWQWAIFDPDNCVFVGYYSEANGIGQLYSLTSNQLKGK
jgi:hypothetical protein